MLFHFNSLEDGLVCIAVMASVTAVLWLWERRYGSFSKQRRH